MRQKLIDLIESQQEAFYKVAFTYVKNEADALDVVHNAIVKALQKLHTVQRPEYLRTWFYRILINESISFIRKNQRAAIFRQWQAQNAMQEETPVDPADVMDLYGAMDKLPVKLKTVVLLRYFEDLKIADIAKITSTNPSTVKSRLSKALHLLKIDLEDIEHDQ